MSIIKKLQSKNKSSMIIKEMILMKIKNYYALFFNNSSDFNINLKEALIEYADKLNNENKKILNSKSQQKILMKKSIGRQFKFTKVNNRTLETEYQIQIVDRKGKENLCCNSKKVKLLQFVKIKKEIPLLKVRTKRLRIKGVLIKDTLQMRKKREMFQWFYMKVISILQ